MTSSGQVEINADEAGPGCTPTIFDSVRCPLAAGGVRVDTYGGNDSVTALDLTEGSVPLITADLALKPTVIRRENHDSVRVQTQCFQCLEDAADACVHFLE